MEGKSRNSREERFRREKNDNNTSNEQEVDVSDVNVDEVVKELEREAENATRSNNSINEDDISQLPGSLQRIQWIIIVMMIIVCPVVVTSHEFKSIILIKNIHILFKI